MRRTRVHTRVSGLECKRVYKPNYNAILWRVDFGCMAHWCADARMCLVTAFARAVEHVRVGGMVRWAGFQFNGMLGGGGVRSERC